MARTQPISIRLDEHTDLLVRDEVQRSGRARSLVIEELASEAAKARLFPGIAFRDSPRRAWAIGSGLDVWQLIDVLRSYEGDEDAICANHPLVNPRHLRLARAYHERFAAEVDQFLKAQTLPLDELRALYPFLEVGP